MAEELTNSYITMPKGFKANGISAGMKCSDPANINENDPKSSYLDVGMVYSDTLCNVAGVYTSNLVKGHSLTRSIDIIENTGEFTMQTRSLLLRQVLSDQDFLLIR